MSTLEVGITGSDTTEVTADMSPPHLAPTIVISTPDMIRLMEEVAAASVQPLLEEADQTTVGIHVNVSHEKAARGGEMAEITSTLSAVAGGHLTFDVQVAVGDRIIGRGTHERFVVDRSRFRG